MRGATKRHMLLPGGRPSEEAPANQAIPAATIPPKRMAGARPEAPLPRSSGARPEPRRTRKSSIFLGEGNASTDAAWRDCVLDFAGQAFQYRAWMSSLTPPPERVVFIVLAPNNKRSPTEESTATPVPANQQWRQILPDAAAEGVEHDSGS
eukprot:CAMPEP_0185762614 /NCGR_PEP_ID=MMETSP1174-20130828/21575_1 /TAXON_ID=35687 /ORGANISM="Dictyocha speculum, Strain CCMP1381" /LENGTH=150 /DNA_ID=CAMNT_0028444349 /DNA_START=527 /DNA_END=979 /DNA_ORIENTATION=-